MKKKKIKFQGNNFIIKEDIEQKEYYYTRKS